MVKVESGGQEFYMDGWLYNQSLRIKNRIVNSDNFKILLIDGKERSGKSVLAQQIAKAIDPSFTEDRMCGSAEQFEYWLNNAEKGMVIVFDESYTGLGAEKSRSKVTTLLREKLMGVGQLNICIIFVIQKIWKLEKYAALEVSDDTGLIHVYTKMVNGEPRRGFWAFFNVFQKELIIDLGRKHGGQWAYSASKVGNAKKRGRFYNQYVINEKLYRENKLLSYASSEVKTGGEKYKDQRNILLLLLHENLGLTLDDLSALCKSRGCKLARSQISTILNGFNNK